MQTTFGSLRSAPYGGLLVLIILTMMVSVSPLTGTASVVSGSPAGGSEEPEVFGWGSNTRLELGPGNARDNFHSPTRIALDSLGAGRITDIQGATQYSCAVADGRVSCWGIQDAPFGTADGVTPATDVSAPIDVYRGGALSSLTVTDLSLSRHNACAVASGAAYCWSTGGAPLGTGAIERSWVPQPVNIDGVLAGRTVQQVSVQARYACAAADGRAFCWGDNLFGTLGSGSSESSAVPVAVDTSGVLGDRYVTQVVTGENFACALASGDVFCWGVKEYLGAGRDWDDDSQIAYSPVAVKTTGALAGRTVTSLQAGRLAACVLADGIPVCWGSAGYIADGPAVEPTYLRAPGPLAGRTATQLVMGQEHGCALADAAVYCWGSDGFGQVGDGDNDTEQGLAVRKVVSNGALAGHTIVALSAGSDSDQTFALTGISPAAELTPTAAPAVGEDFAPFGSWDRGTLSGAYFSVSGWAADANDPDAVTTVDVSDSAADGTQRTWSFRTGGSRPDVTTVIPFLPGRTGFDALVHLDGPGDHTVCLTARNGGPGGDTQLGCRVVTVPPLSGRLEVANSETGSLVVGTFAANPDTPGLPIEVPLSVSGPEGPSVTTVTSGEVRTDALASLPWAGIDSGFSTRIPVRTAGSWTVCAIGDAAALGCVTTEVRDPFGYLDVVTLDPTTNEVSIAGWIIDPNSANGAARYTLSLDGGASWSNEFRATAPRPDVNAVFPDWAGAEHGVLMTMPLDPGTYPVCIRAEPSASGRGPVLIGCQTIVVPD